MLGDTTMRPPFLESISQRQSWQELEHLSANLQAVSLLTAMIPLIASLPAICLLDAILRKGQEFESTQEELEQ